jgi:hypothetical protein
VRVERQVLTLVNNAFPSASLNGLTEVAISRWVNKNGSIPVEVSDLVLNISKRARLDIDASRDVFFGGELELESSVDSYIDVLKIRCTLGF